MPTHPLASISPQAAALLAKEQQNLAHSKAPQSIQDTRKETLSAYRPAVERALLKYPVTTTEINVAGIACMQVTPPDPDPSRQILFCFGGGFIQGSPFEDLPITAALAIKTCATIIVPHYRLAPEHPYPAALDDITTVAQHLLAANPKTLLSGESAGGNLALALTHRLRKLGLPTPSALTVLSPATDLEYVGDSHDADRDPFLPAAVTDDLRAAYLGTQNLRDPEISPLYGKFDATFPPTFVTTGTRDMLMSGCLRLARVMRQANAPVDLRIWEGLWHVFEFYPDIPEADASLSEIADFLNTHF
jgi:monoterpene epsilon-lactone hydrolase